MHKPHMCLYSRLAGVHDAPVLIFRPKPHCLTVSKLQTMSLSLPLNSYVELYHPARLPMNPSLSSQDSSSLLTLTDYTDQFIMSAQEHEDQLGSLYARHSGITRDALAKMDETGGERDTAFLIEKTDQQTFVSFFVGVLLTGFIYTGLLLFKPSGKCSIKKKEEEKGLVIVEKLLDEEEEQSLRTDFVKNSPICALFNSPLLTSLAIVWVPIVLYTAFTGFMVREVELLERAEEEEEQPVNIRAVSSTAAGEAIKQFSTNEKLKTPKLSRYDLIYQDLLKYGY